LSAGRVAGARREASADNGGDYQAGLRLAVEGRLDAAVETLSRVVITTPGHAEAHNNLGLALQGLGRVEAAIACFRRAATIRPSYVLALTNLGAAFAALGRHEEAIAQYQAALDLDPAEPGTLNNLGVALHQTGRDEEATEALRKAAACPDFPEAAINLGDVLAGLGREAEAMDHYRAALALRPDDIDTLLKVAFLLHRAGQFDAARARFRQAIENNPSLAAAHAGLGKVLQEIGEIEAARASYRQAITVDPGGLGPYLDLAHITRLGADDPALIALSDLAGRADTLPEDEQINLHFALGKALSDAGEMECAFEHLLAGNALRRARIDYDERKILLGFRRTQAVFTAAYLGRWATGGNPSPRPIFIVGMPRSGSTLVEQILANHPGVICAGETDALHESLKAHGAASVDWLKPDPAFEPTAEQLAGLSATYLERLSTAAGCPSQHASIATITNKMLGNFRYLGLIHQLFPSARILHTYRDPIDTCLSCFSINFSNQPFTFDLGELGRYYSAYAILMHHWKQVLPAGTILEVRYDHVVGDLEASARAIVAHCGLEWDDACLKFHEAERPVRTASAEQVRRPIYRSSLRRWRPAAATLAPLLEGLGLARRTQAPS
jgi:tetratricopeptide (TPR) repeat protein